MANHPLQRSFDPSLVKSRPSELGENLANAMTRQNDRIARILDALTDISGRLKKLETQAKAQTRK